MSENLYIQLHYRYKNKIKLIDDYGTKGILLFNEEVKQFWRFWFKFKYSKFSYVKTERVWVYKFNCQGFYINKKTFKIDIVEFAKYGITKGHDWRLFGQPEWKALQPKKKKKFMNPKRKRHDIS